MLAVHAFWSHKRGLCLWAEDSERAVKSPSQALRTARPHPFAAEPGELVDLHAGKCARATLLLPSLRTAPLDSPELVRVTPRPEPRKGPTLLPWSVPVVCFDPSAALTVLDEPAEQVRYGASVRFLAELTAFARELAERGRVLPALDRSADRCTARWRPVVQGPDIVAVQALVATMPPVCRAETGTPADTRGQDPTAMVSGALRALVDAAVRERLAATGGSLLDVLPPRRGRRPRRVPIVEAWLQALSMADGRFDAEPSDVDELERTLAPWAGFGTGQAGPARVTFRLTEVDPVAPTPLGGVGDVDVAGAEADQTTSSASRWRLEFLLQSVEDPSLLVPAAQIWTAADGLGAG